MNTETPGERQGAPLAHVALRGRCPRCGEGPLYDGYLTVADACSVCSLSFVGHDTGDGPAFFIMLPLCVITAVLALMFDLAVQPPMWWHIVIWPIVIVAVSGILLRPVKALMIALQYRHRDVETIDKSGQQ